MSLCHQSELSLHVIQMLHPLTKMLSSRQCPQCAMTATSVQRGGRYKCGQALGERFHIVTVSVSLCNLLTIQTQIIKNSPIYKYIHVQTLLEFLSQNRENVGNSLESEHRHKNNKISKDISGLCLKTNFLHRSQDFFTIQTSFNLSASSSSLILAFVWQDNILPCLYTILKQCHEILIFSKLCTSTLPPFLQSNSP